MPFTLWQMISELAAMMVERLNSFRQATRRLPDRILVFRDGECISKSLPRVTYSLLSGVSEVCSYRWLPTLVIDRNFARANTNKLLR